HLVAEPDVLHGQVQPRPWHQFQPGNIAQHGLSPRGEALHRRLIAEGDVPRVHPPPGPPPRPPPVLAHVIQPMPLGQADVARTIATSTVVSAAELTEFIKVRHHAIVITTRKDGGPQASPVTCGVDDAGRIVIATYPERAKTRNARRDPEHVSVLFLSD